MRSFFSSLFKKDNGINKVRCPIFIIGCGRSGTKLLCDLLKAHHDLVEPSGYPDGEDHVGWIEHGKAIISGLGSSPEINKGQTGFNMCLAMDEGYYDAETADAMHNYYAGEVLNGDSSKRVVNKNPHLSNKLRYVRSIFPDARFLHIIRDCLPVVASWKKMMELHYKQVLFLPDSKWPCLWVLNAPENENRSEFFRNEKVFPGGGGVLLLVEYWNQVNANIEKQCADFMDQLKVVRYEDLVERPNKILGDIYSFCDLSGEVVIKETIKKNTARRYRHLLDNHEVQDVLAQSEVIRRKFGYT